MFVPPLLAYMVIDVRCHAYAAVPESVLHFPQAPSLLKQDGAASVP